MEALKDYDYGCLVFIDLILIPRDDLNTYKTSRPPWTSLASSYHTGHSSGACQPWVPEDHWLHQHLLGLGVKTMTSASSVNTVNALDKALYKWGPFTIYNRLSVKGMPISRAGKCRMSRHNRDEKSKPDPRRFNRPSTHQREHVQGRHRLGHIHTLKLNKMKQNVTFKCPFNKCSDFKIRYSR